MESQRLILQRQAYGNICDIILVEATEYNHSLQKDVTHYEVVVRDLDKEEKIIYKLFKDNEKGCAYLSFNSLINCLHSKLTRMIKDVVNKKEVA